MAGLVAAAMADAPDPRGMCARAIYAPGMDVRDLRPSISAMGLSLVLEGGTTGCNAAQVLSADDCAEWIAARAAGHKTEELPGVQRRAAELSARIVDALPFVICPAGGKHSGPGDAGADGTAPSPAEWYGKAYARDG